MIDAFASTEEPDTSYKPLPFEQDIGNQTHRANGQNGNQVGNYEQSQNDDVRMDHEPFGSGIKEDG